MDNSMDALSALLSDPAALSAAMEMAKGLLGGQGQNAAAPAESTPQPKPPVPTAEDDKTRLLLALKPFLSPKRSEKVGTVIGLMRAMQVMGTILPHEEGK